MTANPQLYRIENGIYDVDPIDVSFHATVEVWQNGWDDEHRTVRPETLRDAALKAAEEYPHKRVIVHFMQPHAPYIGPTGVSNLPTDYLNFWSAYDDGEFDIDLETAKQAYRENLKLVLPSLKDLLDKFQGKTVVTADHGELLGDRDWPIPVRRYGHPPHTNHTKLVEVPWFEHTNGERKRITSEPTDEANTDLDSAVVEERLRDLGYAK